MTTRAVRGYALLMVIMVLALIALGLSTVMFIVDSNLTETRRILGETRCFYAADSASRLASATVQAVAVTLPPQMPPAAAIAAATTAVCNIAPGGCASGLPMGIMPPGVTMTDFKVNVVPTTTIRSITSGALKGVVVCDSGMSVYLEGRDDGTGRVCHVQDSFFTGSVSPFQFMMFAAGDANWYGRTNRNAAVPVYSSGDLCLSARSPATLALTQVGAGGQLNVPSGGGRPRKRHRRARAPVACPAPLGGAGLVTVAGVAFAGVPDDVSSFEAANELKLPIATPPSMQGDNATPDLLSVRWTMDPVMNGRDPKPVQQLKLAEIADIRIIDGVWYVKSTGVAWPGMAVWSDHPGGGVDSDAVLNGLGGTRRIGQLDIKAQLEAGGFRSVVDPWPPRHYSYYETDATGKMLDDQHGVGVVSYGAVASVGGFFQPALFPGKLTTLAAPTCAAAGFVAFSACGQNYATALLDGARAGFRDYNALARASVVNQAAEAKVLPINIDVHQLVLAFADPNPGELKRFFPAGSFNGVIWVSSTWSNMLDGLTGAPAPFDTTVNPEQGVGFSLLPVPPVVPGPEATELTAGRVATLANNGAGGFLPIGFGGTPAAAGAFLPHPLCGAALGAADSYATGYEIMPCTGALGSLGALAYGAGGTDGARPTAVRLINGSDLTAFQTVDGTTHGAVTDAGLTIATNIALYVQGDWNATGPNAFGNFTRSMLAGDIITALSDRWDDGQAAWTAGSYGGGTPLARTGGDAPDIVGGAATTVTGGQIIRGGIVVGWTPSTRRPNDQDVEDLVRVIESFPAAASLELRGAVAAGYTAVFRDDFEPARNHHTDWKYDASLSDTTLQPPGAPRFLVGVTGKWKDSR